MAELVGFPGYYIQDGHVFHNGRRLKPASGCVKLYRGNGVFVRLSIAKIIYAAERGIDPENLKSSRILIRAGGPVLNDELCSHMRDVRALYMKSKTKESRIKEIKQYIREAEILLDAISSDSWDDLFELIESYRPLLYDFMYKRYSISSTERRCEVFSQARIMLCDRIEHGNVVVNLRGALIKYVQAVVSEQRKYRTVYMENKRHGKIG